MKLQINGESREVVAGATVMDVLAMFGLVDGRIAVEHNGRILERTHYARTVLREADTLEIVRFVGGG